MQGRIIRGISGFYYVKADNTIYECKARGRFRYDELTPVVGDVVDFDNKTGNCVIEKIYKRTSLLVRPPVANVNLAVIVVSFVDPQINTELLNRFLIYCELKKLKAIVCFNKMDIISEAPLNILKNLESAGYEYYFIKAKQNYGISELKKRLKGSFSVLCGPSGVGKSTILNKLCGRDFMKTGEISEKIMRGKNTTRHCELLDMDDYSIVDSPGFSAIDTKITDKNKLIECFPEFNEYIGECKFSSCMHDNEPHCAIKKAVEDKLIYEERYKFYIKLLHEIKSGRNNL